MLRHQFNMINFKHPLVFSYLFILVDNFMSSYDWLIYFSHVYLMNFCLELKFLLFPVKYMTLYFLVSDFILFLLLCHHLVLSYDTLILLCINDTTWFYRDKNSQTYLYFFFMVLKKLMNALILRLLISMWFNSSLPSILYYHFPSVVQYVASFLIYSWTTSNAIHAILTVNNYSSSI